jgi:hypothetical protein
MPAMLVMRRPHARTRQVHGGAHAEVRAVRLQPAVGGAMRRCVQLAQEGPAVSSLLPAPSRQRGAAVDAVHAQRVDRSEQRLAVVVAGPALVAISCLSSAIERSSLSRLALKVTSLMRSRCPGVVGTPLAQRGVDLHQQQVVGRALGDQRQQRRVAGVAAVPVGLAVDLHRLEQQRQAGRGQHHVGVSSACGRCAAAAAHVVAAMKSRTLWQRRTRSKSTVSARMSRSGFRFSGLSWYGE